MDFNNLSVEELKRGYLYHQSKALYICIHCGKVFPIGEVFPLDGRFFDAAHAIKKHISLNHNDRLEKLLSLDSKYNTTTENQNELLLLFASGESDNEIAKRLKISPSTVRRQRFTFREKAKQARFYLAVYELAMESVLEEDEAFQMIHDHATMVDDRYMTTVKEKEKILDTFFTSLSPLKLKVFSAKEKNKIVILTRIAEEFDKDKKYTEKEVNDILKAIYQDYAEVRRYLIQYGFIDRTTDGTQYWLK